MVAASGSFVVPSSAAAFVGAVFATAFVGAIFTAAFMSAIFTAAFMSAIFAAAFMSAIFAAAFVGAIFAAAFMSAVFAAACAGTAFMIGNQLGIAVGGQAGKLGNRQQTVTRWNGCHTGGNGCTLEQHACQEGKFGKGCVHAIGLLKF